MVLGIHRTKEFLDVMKYAKWDTLEEGFGSFYQYFSIRKNINLTRKIWLNQVFRA